MTTSTWLLCALQVAETRQRLLAHVKCELTARQNFSVISRPHDLLV